MNLNKIERDIKVQGIKHKGVSVWPIIKCYLIDLVGERKVIKKVDQSFIKIVLNGIWLDVGSLLNLRKSKYWVFSTSQTRFRLNEESIDRVASSLLRYLPNIVLIENPIPKGKTSRSKFQKNEFYVGMSLMFLGQFVVQKLTRKPKIKDFEKLEKYLDADLERFYPIYHRIYASMLFYGFLFRIIRPKMIFAVCYYCNFGMIWAAKKKNIPVVEMQHGLIADAHRAYNFTEKQDNRLMPDYLLSYGAESTKVALKGNIVTTDRVLNYGNTFLQDVYERLSASKTLIAYRRRFERVICVTGQLELTDRPLIQMLSEICVAFPRVGFLYKPRHLDSFLDFSGQDNLIRCDGINTYELMKYCDYHLTVYSTCALESLALGTPNISVDIKGYYKRYLHDILKDNPYNFEVGSKLALKNLILSLNNETFIQEKVKASVHHIFAKGVDRTAFHSFFKGVIN
ncbi:hypothetical protein [Flagellimonas algicola]|uniref:Glycosyltransferase involved in cell wall biosynthesis n=1 Tax=Flagellimonas algicola TaxID=2583815 RepID=A0ABY2WKI8_9FLAO|nr:hypothetical protein [Allomuricauda algicola]TMU55056.1 hypothetical protein FGG15_12775 [Allomuricauda algicola]